MKIFLLMIVMIFSACGTLNTEIKKPTSPKQALKSCTEYCNGSSMLSYRNERTYFCECFNGQISVVSKTGTIYK